MRTSPANVNHETLKGVKSGDGSLSPPFYVDEHVFFAPLGYLLAVACRGQANVRGLCCHAAYIVIFSRNGLNFENKYKGFHHIRRGFPPGVILKKNVNGISFAHVL